MLVTLCFYSLTMLAHIPPEIAMLGAALNVFSGTMPQEITKLTNLRELWIENNYITGKLPLDLGSMTSLGNFFLFFCHLC